MDFNFILPRCLAKKNTAADSDSNKPIIEKIQFLKERLIAVGYNPGEVNYMISNLTNHQELTALNSIQLKKVEQQLTDQLCMARLCLDFAKSSQ